MRANTDTSEAFRAEGRSLVTERPTYEGKDSEIDWDHRNEKIDDALKFGRDLRAAVVNTWGGNPGTPAVSLGIPDVGIVTFVVHTPRGDYVVKAIRAEEYPQEF